MSANYSRYGVSQIEENIEAAEKERIKSYGGVQTLTSAAVRALEFCEPEYGNYLNLKVLNNLSTKLRSLETNWTANAVFVGSRSIDFFSNGIHDDDAEAEGEALFAKIQDLSAQVNDYADQKLLALYGGYITGTPFGMLMGSHVCHFQI
jgi:enoyl-CoA hydratase/carnithine racemase